MVTRFQITNFKDFLNNQNEFCLLTYLFVCFSFKQEDWLIISLKLWIRNLRVRENYVVNSLLLTIFSCQGDWGNSICRNFKFLFKFERLVKKADTSTRASNHICTVKNKNLVICDFVEIYEVNNTLNFRREIWQVWDGSLKHMFSEVGSQYLYHSKVIY